VSIGDPILEAAAERLRQETPILQDGELRAFVESFLERRGSFLGLRQEHGSPLYVVDEKALLDRARQFREAFEPELPDVSVCYAVKSNNCPELVSILAGAGLGLDVSSGKELELALGSGTKEVLFTGPGKTDDELFLATQNAERVTLMLDSLGELRRLERVAAGLGQSLKVGVRLTTDESGPWRRFGIPLAKLQDFMDETNASGSVKVSGLQFHTSWNLDPGPQVGFITRLGRALQSMALDRREEIEFVDIGGGFWPPRGEWLQFAGTPRGRLCQAAGLPPEGSLRHYHCASAPIGVFVREIAQAVRTSLFPHVQCRIIAEPGRWLCHDGMHVLLTVVDKKAEDLAIADGGTNAVGWERFEVDYFPVINLSRPGTAEHACWVMGSLCTPRDFWGYSYHGQSVEPGDALLIPTQGAYTYSLRQDFIKPLPEVAVLRT